MSQARYYGAHATRQVRAIRRSAGRSAVALNDEQPLPRSGEKIEGFDGYIFVTAEYNHGIPGVLKNAIDYVAHVFAKKPAAYVGYGGVGAARAIEQLRLVNIEQQIAPLKSAMHIGGADFVDVLLYGKSLADKPHLVPSVKAMLDELAGAGWARE
jgi:NAD(P)H-dependent FMN reductase